MILQIAVKYFVEGKFLTGIHIKNIVYIQILYGRITL